MNLLPESDVDYLNDKAYVYDLIPNHTGIFLVIRNFTFPLPYSPQEADLLIRIPPGYPNAPLDMFWTSPDVKLSNGSWPLRSNVHENINGQKWQRWSRHGKWRMGVDSLRSYIPALIKEISKGI